MKFKLIVAICKGGGIGNNNKLPWRIKEDLNYFSKVTKGNGNNAIIMGRKTFTSIGSKGLFERDNLILTSSCENNNINNLLYFNDIHSIKEHCREKNYDDVWVIGGETIYKQFLDAQLIDMCSVTFINKYFECDTFFPKFGKEWLLENHYKLSNKKNYDVNIATIVLIKRSK
jgi:dihydrofolate reductase